MIQPNWDSIAANTRNLQSEWLALIDPLKSQRAMHWFALLQAAYSASDRHYHNLEHISQMLSWLAATWNDSAKALAIAQYATWFHDAVYDPKAGDNEERSAALSLEAAEELSISNEIAKPAADWILRTKTHDAGGSMPCAHFLDCDLAILGAPENLYRAYANAIRKEYVWVPDEAYRSGRSQVLTGFLNRRGIYATDRMAIELEAQARRNLRNELRELESLSSSLRAR